MVTLSIILFIGGNYFKLPFVRYIGLSLLFLTGIGVLDGLQYDSNTIVDTEYIYTSGVLTNSYDVITPEYETWGETNLGFMIVSISAFIFILDLILSWKKPLTYGNEYE